MNYGTLGVVPHEDKAWVPRVLDYLVGAETLASSDLSYGLGLSVMLLHDAIEVAIRCWLRYDKRRSPHDVRNREFHQLLEELNAGFPALSGTVLHNLAFLQDKRNSLVHDVSGAPVTKDEWMRIRSSCIAATEALLGEPLNLQLLTPVTLVPPAQGVGAKSLTQEQVEASRLLTSAVKLFYAGRLAESEEAVREARSLTSDTPAILHLVGLCERKRRKFQAALRNFTTAAQLPGGDRDITLQLDLAEAQLTVGQVQDAAATALRVLDLGARGPERARAHAIAGDSLAEAGDFGKAEQQYREALLEDPKHQRHIRGLLKALRQLGKYDEAIDLASEAMRDAPKNSNYPLDRARVFWSRNKGGDRNTALGDLSIAEELTAGKNNAALLVKAHFFREVGLSLIENDRTQAETHFHSAIVELQKGLLHTPKNFRPALRNAISLLFLDLCDGANAVREARTGIEENPIYVTNYMALARALIYSERYEDATEISDQGFDRAPARPGRFWCIWLKLTAQVLQNRPIKGWVEHLNELKRLGSGLKTADAGFELQPVWAKILVRSKILHLENLKQLGELAEMAHLPMQEQGASP